MDGTFNYKKPCRSISMKERKWIKEWCKKNPTYDVKKEGDCIESCFYSNKVCDCTGEMILKKNEEMFELQVEWTIRALEFMNKGEFQKTMKDILKDIDEYFLPYVWITISPKKFENKLNNFRIMYLLDKTLREYFYQCYRKCDEIHWCLEFGPNGDHAHAHILCRPIEAQQKSFVKNFSRDFTTLWKKGQTKESKYIDILDLKKVAFKLNTLRRPEFIDDKLKYLRNETKDAIHENPRDAELFSEMKHPVIKKYENC